VTSLRIPRRIALAAIAALVLAASAASFSESYRGLFLWAVRHGLSGIWAWAFPLQIDTFIGVGELALFVALADGWSARSRAGAWIVSTAGIIVSVAANVGHVAGHDLASRATAAVPPLAAAAALSIGLGVLKRVVAKTAEPAAVAVVIPDTEATPLPDIQPDSSRPRDRTPKPAKSGRRVAAILRANPDLSGAELGRKLGVSERQGRRLLAQVNES
jgi:Protein of unknown function (DUF2637)